MARKSAAATLDLGAPDRPCRARLAGADAWQRVNALFESFAYDLKQRWSTRTGLVSMRFGKARVVMEVYLQRAFNGLVESADLHTTVVRPAVQEPVYTFEHAISIRLYRPVADPTQCAADIYLISANPQHGVDTGSDALEIATRLCSLLGCASMELSDASRIACPAPAGATVDGTRK